MRTCSGAPWPTLPPLLLLLQLLHLTSCASPEHSTTQDCMHVLPAGCAIRCYYRSYPPASATGITHALIPRARLSAALSSKKPFGTAAASAPAAAAGAAAPCGPALCILDAGRLVPASCCCCCCCACWVLLSLLPPAACERDARTRIQSTA